MTLIADFQYGLKLSRLVSQQALQVADKAVHIAFSCCLSDDVLVIVVPQAAAQLFIVHLRFILSLTPQQRHLGTMTQFNQQPFTTQNAHSVLEENNEVLRPMRGTHTKAQGELHAFRNLTKFI